VAYGLPETISRSGHTLIATEDNDEEEIQKAKRYDYIGKWGLIVLIVGFVLQLISNFL
jgi:hypothetical protein